MLHSVEHSPLDLTESGKLLIKKMDNEKVTGQDMVVQILRNSNQLLAKIQLLNK